MSIHDVLYVKLLQFKNYYFGLPIYSICFRLIEHLTKQYPLSGYIMYVGMIYTLRIHLP